MSGEYEVGLPWTHEGVTVALATHSPGDGRARLATRHHYFARYAEAWTLIDIRTVAERCGVLLPPQLHHDYYADAHMDRLRTAARYLAQVRAAAPTPEPIPTAPPQASPRPWWIDLDPDMEDTA